jgi:hypothetical protein
LRGAFLVAGFLGAVFFAGFATDLTTALVAFSATVVGAGAAASTGVSTLKGHFAASVVVSTGFLPNILFNRFNISKFSLFVIYFFMYH